MIVSHTIYSGYTPLRCTIKVEQTGPLELTFRAGTFITTGEATTHPVPRQDEIDAMVNRILGEKYNLRTNAQNVDQQVNEIKALEAKLVAMQQIRERAIAFCESGDGEQVEGHARLRVWHHAEDHMRSQAHHLYTDEALKVKVDPQFETMYDVQLCVASEYQKTRQTNPSVHIDHPRYGGDLDILAHTIRRERGEHPKPLAEGIRPIHWIAAFTVPAGTTDLADIPIHALNVIVGEPPGVPPGSWSHQTGRM